MLAGFCDLARGGQDFSQEARYLKSELKRLRSPQEQEYCWGYDWDYMSLRGTKLPAFSPNSIASYFCGEALLDMAEVFGDREAAEMGESVGRFIVSRLNQSLDTPEHLCFSYTPGDRTLIYNSSALAGAYLARLVSRRPNTEVCFPGPPRNELPATRAVARGRMVLRYAPQSAMDRRFPHLV